MATNVLETYPGKKLTKVVGEEIFDDVFGMKPKTAYMVSEMVLHTGLTLGFEHMFANMVAPNKITGTEIYDPNNPGHVKSATEILEQAGGENYGGFPYLDEVGIPQDVSDFLISNGNRVGVISKSLNVLGQPQHIGIAMKGLSRTVALEHPPNPIAFLQGYGIGGISHQKVSSTLLQAGYSTTISEIGGGWSTIPSTFIYGNYGGALAGVSYLQQELEE